LGPLIMGVRPFNDRARPDPTGNVIPYDTPTTAEVLERFGNGHQAAWRCLLTDEVDIELQPFAIGGTRTIDGRAVPYREPELLFPENPRRGALTLWSFNLTVAGGTWRIAGTRDNALRDDSSLIVFASLLGSPEMMPRFSWSGPVWTQQRSGDANLRLCAISEDWAR
jgi:hypothetical protein